MDLLSPEDISVSDGITSEWHSISYPTVDHLASLVLSEGRGAYLVSADNKRMVPIHQPLLGIWDNVVVAVATAW